MRNALLYRSTIRRRKPSIPTTIPRPRLLKMLYIDLKVPGGLGGAYVWAVKDDDANGTMVKTMSKVLNNK